MPFIQSQELAKKIESSLKEKLDKLGLDGDKPIEIKVSIRDLKNWKMRWIFFYLNNLNKH